MTAAGEVVGFDAPAVLVLGDALGYNRRTMALLLPAAEAGMVEGFRKLKAGEEGEDPREE